jgi:hypothetical protein
MSAPFTDELFRVIADYALQFPDANGAHSSHRVRRDPDKYQRDGGRERFPACETSRSNCWPMPCTVGVTISTTPTFSRRISRPIQEARVSSEAGSEETKLIANNI